MDIGLFARHHGIATFDFVEYEPYFKLNPAKSKSLTLSGSSGNTGNAGFTLKLPIGWVNTLQYMAVLGHNFFDLNENSVDSDFRFEIRTHLDDGAEALISHTSTVNCAPYGDNFFTTPENGYSLVRFNNPSEQNNKIVINFVGDGGTAFNIGDVSAGWTYEMPHSPDLSLKLSYQNESISTQTTKGGVSLSNSGWSEAPDWLGLPQWTLHNPADGITNFKGMMPSTRRQYDLSFSFLNDTDLLNQYYPGSKRSQKGIMQGRNFTGDSFMFTGMKDNFFSKCWMGSANGKLPFIFQPDKDVDEFAICKFNTDTFTLNQVANNVYDVSVSLTEIW